MKRDAAVEAVFQPVRPPTTFEELRTGAKKLQDAEGMKYPIALPLLSTADLDTAFAATLGSQDSAFFVDPETKTPNFEKEPTAKALEQETKLKELQSKLDDDLAKVKFERDELSKYSQALAARLEEICGEVSAAIAEGARIIVLSDRHSNAERAPIPSLLLTGAVQGVQAMFSNQPCQVPVLRPLLASVLGHPHPQVLLRVGYPTEAQAPTPRRPVEDVLEPKPKRRPRPGAPPLRVVSGGLEDVLKKRTPPKDKRYLN